MPLYAYKAATRDGEVVEGVRDAADEASLLRDLQAAGQLPIRIAPAGSSSGGLGLLRIRRRRVGHKEVALITQELATLLQAGLPLDRALRIIIDLTADDHVRRLVEQVLERVRGGAPLSKALEEVEAGIFSRFYISMVRAGEAGGSLETVLLRLTEYLERARALRESVLSALIYPAILFTMALASLFILLAFVVPQFTQLFADADRMLPLPTRIVVGTADLLQSWGWLLILLVAAAVWGGQRALQNPARRYAWDMRLLNWPLVGDLLRKSDLARMARTLGTLLGNGVPLLAALAIVRDTMGNLVLAEAVESATGSLREGKGVAAPLLATGLFPRLGMEMLRLGEETGRLEEMLLRVAETYDQEVRTAVQRMLTLLEPALIVGLGLAIGGIIMSILMAILSVNELAF